MLLASKMGQKGPDHNFFHNIFLRETRFDDRFSSKQYNAVRWSQKLWFYLKDFFSSLSWHPLHLFPKWAYFYFTNIGKTLRNEDEKICNCQNIEYILMTIFAIAYKNGWKKANQLNLIERQPSFPKNFIKSELKFLILLTI